MLKEGSYRIADLSSAHLQPLLPTLRQACVYVCSLYHLFHWGADTDEKPEPVSELAEAAFSLGTSLCFLPDGLRPLASIRAAAGKDGEDTPSFIS